MIDKVSNNEPKTYQRYASWALLGSGAILLAGGLYSCSAISGTQQSDTAYETPVSKSDLDISYGSNELTEVIISDKSSESEEVIQQHNQHNIEPKISTGALKFIKLFGSNHSAYAYDVNEMNGVIDFTPPVRDGVFYSWYIFNGQNRDYDFGNELSTDKHGNIEGDLLIGGHSNSGGDWVMNNIGDLKLGNIISVKFEDAVAKAEITKITYIKKKGDVHLWPGFEEALGENGAIYACKLSEENGKTIQSGYATVAGLKVIELKKA